MFYTLSHALNQLVPSKAKFEALEARVAALEGGDNFNTGNGSERVSALPIIGFQQGAKVIFRHHVGEIKVGARIEAFSEFQCTSEQDYNVMLGSFITLVDNVNKIKQHEITEAIVRNITPPMHHDFHTRAGSFVVPSDIADGYIQTVGYAAASAAQSGDTISVDYDMGRLWGRIIRSA